MGIGLAILAGTAISGITSAISGNRQASAANRAARLQSQAGAQARADLAPWRAAGEAALDETSALMGLSGEEAQTDAYGRFETSPDYQFRFDEGVNAIDASASARGGLFSGNTGRALAEYGQGLASTEYGNYINRLFSLSGAGQNAAAGQGVASMQTANNQGQSLMAAGQAKAAGAIGVGNAITSGISNQLYYQGLQRPALQAPHNSSYWGR